MTINVLFIGDIVGEPGRDAVRELLPGMVKKYEPDLILANADNATHGRGLNKSHYTELMKMGIDGVSSGDHIWKFEEFVAELDNPDIKVARPANMHKAPGRGYVDFTVKGKKVRLVHLVGQVFMHGHTESPFYAFDKIMEVDPKPDLVIVDIHAEATSEKRMLAEYIGERAQLIVGTHTHVPTADAQILPSGAAFISDLGMVGPQDSSLGADKEEVLKNFLTGLPWRYTVGTGQCELGAVFCAIDATKKQAVSIEHIRQFTSSI